jgi:predicted site-specific integrase-resolvase
MGQMKTEENKQTERVITTDEAAKEWGITKKALYSLVRKGKIRPITNLGKSWYFLPSDFNPTVFVRL